MIKQEILLFWMLLGWLTIIKISIVTGSLNNTGTSLLLAILIDELEHSSPVTSLSYVQFRPVSISHRLIWGFNCWHMSRQCDDITSYSGTKQALFFFEVLWNSSSFCLSIRSISSWVRRTDIVNMVISSSIGETWLCIKFWQKSM